MKVSIVAQEVHSSACPIHWQRLLLVVALLCSLVGTFGVNPQPAFALNPGDVTILMVTDPLLVSDSNGCSSGDGPQAAYVGFKITNATGGTLNNLSVNLSGFVTGFSLAGGQAASQYIGALAAGASDIVYWYVAYPCHTAATFSNTLTVTVSDGGPSPIVYSNNSAPSTTTTENVTTTITSVSTISANAGGLYQGSLLGAGAVVGQIIPYEVTYEFGGVGAGDRYNLQPTGETSFNAGCLQLVNTEIVSSNVTAITAGSTDDLFYYASVSQPGSGYTVTVRYYFQYLCNGVTTSALPYASQTSGSTNVKYAESGYVAANAISFPPATNPFTISKSASPAALPNGGTATYTVLITNTSTFASAITRITDWLPAGATFGATLTGPGNTSAEIATLSSQQPTAGATGTIIWAGGQPTTPFPYESFYVPAGSVLQLVYTANIPSTPGVYTNSATATIGLLTLGPTQAPVSVGSADLSVAKSHSGSFTVGQNGTYTLAVANAGPAPAAGPITLVDTLPTGFGYVSASGGSWSCGASGQTVTCTHPGPLNSGASLSNLALMVSVDGTAAANSVNTATVSSPTPDPTPANNTASDPTTVNPVADLVVLKSVSPANTSPGQQVTFTITARNDGPSVATGVVVNDSLPAGLTYVSDNPSQGSYNPGTGVWTVGNVANGGVATLQLVATVTGSPPLTNTATGSSSTTDPNPGNNQASAVVSAQQADLRLTKTVNAATTNVGSQVPFQIVVTNGGPDAATGVAVSDQLPAGLSFSSSNSTQGSYDSGTGIWSVGTIANGASATLNIVATVMQPGTIINTAQVSVATQPDPDSAPNNNAPLEDDQASAIVTGQQADLVVLKTVNNPNPFPGQQITYQITVRNDGPSQATGIAITDQLPAGLTFVSSNSSQGSYNPGTGIWSVGTLANGASAILDIVATVTSGSSIINTASVSASDQPDPNAPNNTASVTTPSQIADLSLTKTASPSSVNVGGQVTFSIVLSNNGPDAATNITVADVLPAGLTLASANATAGTYNSGTGVWSVATLGNGASATLTIVATVTQAGAIVNTAQVMGLNQFDPDSLPNNNNANEDDQASATVTGQAADLVVVKTVNTPNPLVGQQLTYSVLVRNDGPSDASGIVVTDQLPAGVSFVSASATQGSYNSGTGLWSVGSLASGGSATLSIVATVTSSSPVTNSAAITASDQPDPDPTDNSDSVTTPAQIADLSLTKTVNSATPNVGSQVTYRLTVTNGGPDAATNVVVSDILPAGLILVSATPSQGGYNQGTGAWNVGTLANGANATLDVVATVTRAGIIVNTAQVSGLDQFDPDSLPNNSAPLEDDQASVVISGQEADLVVVKTVNTPNPLVGQQLTYSVLVRNDGPSDASGIVVTDQLPVGVSFVSASATQGSYNSGTGLWSVGSLASGGSATLSIVVTVTSSSPVTNSAAITASDQPDPDPTDNSDSVTTPAQIADLSLIKTANPATPNVGSQVTYMVMVTNGGPDSATNVAVEEQLPAGLTLVSSNPSQGIYNSSTGIWNVGTLASTASATLEIVATVTQAGAIVNTAQVVGLDQFDPDSVPNNNNGNEDDQASAAVTGQQADIVVVKTVDRPNPQVGQQATYTILVRNDGPSDATNVAVTDQLPAGLIFVSASPTQGSYVSSSGIWTVGNLANGASATLTIVATVTTASPVTNTAAVTASDQPDPDGNNNQDSVTTPAQVADLTLTKVAVGSTPSVGGIANFLITVRNLGPDTATNVTVSEELPASLSLVQATPSQGSYDPTTGRWSVGTIPNGGTATMQVAATVLVAGVITNMAQVIDGDQFDPNSIPNNNAAAENDQGSATILAPTSVTLTSFTATAGDGGVTVRWVTSDEQNTWGFHLLRSADREAANAQRVTGALIPATGGGTYSWLDRSPLPGGGYYWLEEIELDGTATLYGPVAVAAAPSSPAGSTRILLPFVVR